MVLYKEIIFFLSAWELIGLSNYGSFIEIYILNHHHLLKNILKDDGSL